MCSSGLLHSVQWQFLTDVSGQPIGPTSRVKKYKKKAGHTLVHNYIGEDVVTDWFSASIMPASVREAGGGGV